MLRRALETARAEAGYRASRSSGPGGQHAQKNETRIEAYLEIDSCSLDETAKERLRERFGFLSRRLEGVRHRMPRQVKTMIRRTNPRALFRLARMRLRHHAQ